jgi:lysine-specific demethylase 8
MAMTAYRGPAFQLVKERPLGSLPRDAVTHDEPLLVRGAIRDWPAWTLWSFDQIAGLRHTDGTEPTWRFQQGLVEQGATRPPLALPVGPYLRELSRAAQTPASADVGLLPQTRRQSLAPGEPFFLNWAHFQSFEPHRLYLGDWPLLEEFPALRRDFAIRCLWGGRRWTWEYVFVGPANTVTGLHQDIHDNWFCQVRGVKELILIPSDQTPHVRPSRKYNLGSVLSEIDVFRLASQGRDAAEFEKLRGCLYARVEAGDALFIPKNTWHAVVALEPSISLATFGLTAREVVTAGAWAEFKHLLHRLRLYRWRNCICHQARA